MTQPLPEQPLVTIAALRSWTQDEIADDDPFALNIIWAVSIRLWSLGSKTWTAETLPRDVRLIGELKAKDFWEHPTGASREGIDVLSEAFVDRVLMGLEFTDDEIRIIATAAGPDTPGELKLGVWSLSVTRGPLETHGAGMRGTYYVPDSWGSGFPLLANGDLGTSR